MFDEVDPRGPAAENFDPERPFHGCVVETSLGDLKMLAQFRLPEARAPATVLIHGAYRSPRDMFSIAAVTPNPIFLALPGHGTPPLRSNGIADWITAAREALAALQRPLFVIGESLGGVLALAAPYPSISLDPPLRTDNLWPAWDTIGSKAGAVIRDLMQPIFAPGQDFRPFIQGGQVITGDVPLLPRRRLRSPPCLFEAEIAPANVHLHRVAGGHLLMQENASACLSLIRNSIEQWRSSLNG